MEAALRRQEMWGFFVLPDVSWAPKGPRLLALINAIQLRPETVLFIDDNAQNRAEALHFVPGLQVADTDFVDTLLEDPRLKGKADPEMTRLAQYHVLAARHTARAGQVNAASAAGDRTDASAKARENANRDFLRASNIVVAIDHAVTGDLDRAIELINRTNQLNFTKRRLPEDPAAAREALLLLLSSFRSQAGLLYARDTYGNYGACGFYLLQNDIGGAPRLVHFCFSCRILGMGIETWLYRQLGRPELRIKGSVVSDPVTDTGAIDWINSELLARPAVAPAGAVVGAPSGTPNPYKAGTLDYVLARGACDIRALSHYFRMTTDTVVEEMNRAEGDGQILANSVLFAVQAITGLDEDSKFSFMPFGFREADFGSLIAAPPPARRAIWIFSFVTDGGQVFRNRATGALMPLTLPKFAAQPGPITDLAATGLSPVLASTMAAQFDYLGTMPDDIFTQAVEKVIACAPSGVGIFILLCNEKFRNASGAWDIARQSQHRNVLIRRAAGANPTVSLLNPADFMDDDDQAALIDVNHFDRLVYFRMFQHIMTCLPEPVELAAPARPGPTLSGASGTAAMTSPLAEADPQPNTPQTPPQLPTTAPAVVSDAPKLGWLTRLWSSSRRS